MHTPEEAKPSPAKDGDAEDAAVNAPPSEKQAEATADDKASEWLTGVKLWAVVGPMTLVFFLLLLDTTIISTAIPSITNHFNSLGDIGWYSAAYLLASGALQPLAGKLYVHFSNKWTFMSFFALFELGSLLCGVANSSKMLIVGRAVAGMGIAGIQNGAMTIISACVPLHKRPALIGICQGFAQLGVVFGPLIGGALTQYSTWRWCFLLNLPAGGVAAILLFCVRVPEATSKPRASEVLRSIHHKLDLVGFALFAPTVVMLLLALQWGGNKYAWNSPTIIGLFCGFAGNFLVWLAWDWHKQDDALIPLSMMRRTTVWSSCIVMGFWMSCLQITSYYLPVYFQSVDGKSPTTSGVYLLPNILGGLVFAIAAGRLVGLIGYYTPFCIAGAALMAIGAGLCSALGVSSSIGYWVGAQLLFGIGRGMGMQMPLVAVQNRLPPAVIPLGIASCMFSSMLFGSIFLSTSATLFTNGLQDVLREHIPAAQVERIIAAGATGFKQVIQPDQLKVVLLAYATSVDRVFYLCTALAALCVPFSFGLGWTNIKEKKKQQEEAKRPAESDVKDEKKDNEEV